ncbi:MAG: P-loop NTPase [Synergistaceae bacterium]|nr:P-loop NTPase [Synergistaceae bacterium]
MKNILICNSKGGVGKSLIADELAFYLEHKNISYNFYDLDSQGGTVHKNSKSDNALVSIIDTPGALQEQLAQWSELLRL